VAFLKAFGSYLPDRVVANAEIAERAGCDAEWIRNVSGISERRVAAADESVADLALRAAEDCLLRGGIQAGELGMVVVASGSAERRFPGPAATVAQRLGANQAPAVDLPLASAGSLFGIALAANLAEAYGNVLVVAAEKMSTVILQEPLDRNTAILFGDGAGACLVTREAGLARVIDAAIHSDGSFAEDLRLEFGQPLAMNGRSVILQASRKIPRVISEVLEKNGRAAAEVDVFLMHQANQNLIDRVAAALGVESAKFYSNIERYGNTSSASMLIAAAEWARESGFKTGVPVVFAAFGAGFHWGAVLVEGV
jgi:3-oxoacyl-[acyl-carrier-protein] synthase III